MMKPKLQNNCKSILLLGSNKGARDKYLSKAWKEIQLNGIEIHQWSSIYETKAWGKTDQGDFLNQTIGIKTTLSPLELLHTLQGIEKKLGRERKEKWGPRRIDIDILYYENLSLNVEELKIPHPGIAQRQFTLIPLSEMIPDYIHPILKKTNQQLLKELA